MRFESKSRLNKIVFNVLNFEEFIGTAIKSGKAGFVAGRIVLKSNGWILTIDQQNKLNIDILKKTDGYGITYTACLEREKGNTFSVEDANDVIGDIFYFLSFARGLWAPPIQLDGYNSHGKSVWKEWGFSKHTSPWNFVLSWFDGHIAQECLQGLFPGFIKLIANHIWQDAIKKVLYWYIISNNLGYIEGSLIMSQTALELLSWNYLVVDKQMLRVYP